MAEHSRSVRGLLREHGTYVAALLGALLLAVSTVEQGIIKRSAHTEGPVLPTALAYSSAINLAIFGTYAVGAAIFALRISRRQARDGGRAWYRWDDDVPLRHVGPVWLVRLVTGVCEWLGAGAANALALSKDPGVGGNPGIIATLVLLSPVYIGSYMLFSSFLRAVKRRRAGVDDRDAEERLRERRLTIARSAIILVSIAGILMLSGDKLGSDAPLLSLSVLAALLAGIAGALKVGAMRKLKKQGVSMTFEILTYAWTSTAIFGSGVLWARLAGIELPHLTAAWGLLLLVVTCSSVSKACIEYANRMHHDAHEITTIQLVTALIAAGWTVIRVGDIPSAWEIASGLTLLTACYFSIRLLGRRAGIG